MASNRIRRDRDTRVVILDSSAIMMPFEFSIDLENELTRLLGKYHVVIPLPIVRELEFLSKNGAGNKKIKAKASLKFIEKFEAVDVCEENGDDSIVELAKKTKGTVVTNDTKLIARLKEIPVPIIFLRAKKKLAMK